MNILIVEDNENINKILTNIMTSEGYNVTSCYNAFDAIEIFQSKSFFCVLTDLMMPVMSGEEFIKKIRVDYYGLIIAITAKTQLQDKLNVLKIGADDYIMKPFDKQEIIFKVRNYANKINKSNHIVRLNDGEFEFNYHDNKISVSRNEINLTSIEFLVLKYFLENLNKIVSREEIMNYVYYDDLDVFDRAIDGHIKNIRKKIKKHSDVDYIKTVYGLGYKMVGEVDE